MPDSPFERCDSPIVLCYTRYMLLQTLVIEVRDIAGRQAEILDELRQGREIILLSEGEPAGVIEPWTERVSAKWREA
ncbi:hypothetical protein AYO38_05710 [bacterium SCGC AG-212-C10]|nr:hypothetical protein AYO38_05710 [bacterium SCGC AG-212-C10]